MNKPHLVCNRLQIRLLESTEADLAADYYTKNEGHLIQTMAEYPDDLKCSLYWKKQALDNIDDYFEDKSCRMFIFTKNGDQIIGTVNFTDILRWVFQGCFLGYGIDRDFVGKGLMTEALGAAIDFAFNVMNLHKILANYQPDNQSSGKLLRKLGFYEVGLAKKEIYIGGQWRDHIETRLINPNWKNTINS